MIGANGPHGMLVARLVAQGKRQEHECVTTPLQQWMGALVWGIIEMKSPATLTAVQVATFQSLKVTFPYLYVLIGFITL